MVALQIAKRHGVAFILDIEGAVTRKRKLDARGEGEEFDFFDGEVEPVGEINSFRFEGTPTATGIITFKLVLDGMSLTQSIDVVEGQSVSSLTGMGTRFNWDRSVEGHVFQHGIHWVTA